MSPTGSFVPQAIIFLRKRLNIDLYRDAPEGTQTLLSDSGFINTELFLERLKHFTKLVKPIVKDPALPILDNHISLYFRRNDILQGIFYYTAVLFLHTQVT
jgi:hypothetical protein